MTDDFHFDQLKIIDAGMGHGYAMHDGWHYYDSVEEAEKVKAKWVAMEKLYNELREVFINHDEYPPLTKWFKETITVEDVK